MKLINSKVEIINQEQGVDGIYKQIELAGRTAYKSEDKITPDSAKAFVDRLINAKHGAVLEHGTVYLKMPASDLLTQIQDHTYLDYERNPYSFTNLAFEGMNEEDFSAVSSCYITTNYRVLVENGWLDDLKYICEPTEYHEKRYTFKITCDRGVSHELVRHRVFSFLQESTRFCNYSKDKFNNELTFIIPTWFEDQLPEGRYTYLDGMFWKDGEAIFNSDVHNARNLFLWGLMNDNDYYIKLINEFQLKPQQARQILPNALKTEVMMTGTKKQWEAFLKLRTAPDAHPDMRKIAGIIQGILD